MIVKNEKPLSLAWHVEYETHDWMRIVIIMLDPLADGGASKDTVRCTSFNRLNCLPPKLCNSLPRIYIYICYHCSCIGNHQALINWCTRFYPFTCINKTHKNIFKSSLCVLRTYRSSIQQIEPISRQNVYINISTFKINNELYQQYQV